MYAYHNLHAVALNYRSALAKQYFNSGHGDFLLEVMVETTHLPRPRTLRRNSQRIKLIVM